MLDPVIPASNVRNARTLPLVKRRQSVFNPVFLFTILCQEMGRILVVFLFFMLLVRDFDSE